jgi:hypothetical protein
MGLIYDENTSNEDGIKWTRHHIKLHSNGIRSHIKWYSTSITQVNRHGYSEYHITLKTHVPPYRTISPRRTATAKSYRNKINWKQHDITSIYNVYHSTSLSQRTFPHIEPSPPVEPPPRNRTGMKSTENNMISHLYITYITAHLFHNVRSPI